MKPLGFAADRTASVAVLLRIVAILAIALTGVASAHP